MQLRPIDRKRLFHTAHKLFESNTVVSPTMMMAHCETINYGAAMHILNTLTRNGRAREIQPGRFIKV